MTTPYQSKIFAYVKSSNFSRYSPWTQLQPLKNSVSWVELKRHLQSFGFEKWCAIHPSFKEEALHLYWHQPLSIVVHKHRKGVSEIANYYRSPENIKNPWFDKKRSQGCTNYTNKDRQKKVVSVSKFWSCDVKNVLKIFRWWNFG